MANDVSVGEGYHQADQESYPVYYAGKITGNFSGILLQVIILPE